MNTKQPTKTLTNAASPDAAGLAALIFDDGAAAGAKRYRVVCRDVDADETFVVVLCPSAEMAEDKASAFVGLRAGEDRAPSSAEV